MGLIRDVLVLFESDFQREVDSWVAKLKVKPASVSIKPLNKKWGQCDTKGNIIFSSDLMHKDKAFQTMVIVHELLHLRVPNHGPLFKAYMNTYVPGWDKFDTAD